MLAPPEKGMTGQIQKNRVNARPNCKTLVFLLQIHFSLHRDTDHMSSFTKPKWLEEARRGSQNKIQGAKGLNFLGWILADDSQKCALQEKSHHRANPQFLIMRQRGLHHREVTMGKCNDFVRARTQVAKSYFMLTINFTPQKGTKEWLEEADTRVSKIKNLGVGRVFFLCWILAFDLHIGPARNRITRPNLSYWICPNVDFHPWMGYDETKSKKKWVNMRPH